MRQFVYIESLKKEVFPDTSINVIYKWVRDPVNPIPHKKCGKRLLFDVEKVFRWFDSLPGKDGDNLNI